MFLDRFLANDIFKKAVIVYDHPKEIEPFYVRVRDDRRTASAFDIIAPKVRCTILLRDIESLHLTKQTCLLVDWSYAKRKPKGRKTRCAQQEVIGHSDRNISLDP